MRKIKFVKYRRKREGRTDYKKRLALLKSSKLRLIIRKSLKNITVQVVKYEKDGDKVVITTCSRELKKLGWSGYGRNLPAGYLVGLLCGTKAKKQKCGDMIVDAGLQKLSKGNLVYSVVKGVVDSGVNVACSEEVFPKEERIQGKHISDKVVKDFEKVKANILKV
tara:strand:+ start:1919 stop:2413 length:495 start_codon:yes stop_codon:yes gene_type:complete